MPRFTFACFALMSCALLAGSGCDGDESATGGGGAGGTPTTGGTGGTGGSSCVPEAEQCDGLDNDCDGQVDEDCPCTGQTQVCYSGPQGTKGVGSCVAGTQTCDEAGNWGPCVGETLPKDEECNTVDDDCNGTVDDMGSIYCGVGACMGSAPVCDGGAPGTCVPGSPSPEVCDGIDNDCNQLVDETYPNKGGPCDSGLPGVCTQGTTQCVLEGATKTAKCVPNQMPSVEACDGLDNDCNGAADDDIPGTGGACVTDLAGPCTAGTVACQDDVIGCFPDVMPSSETCDGVDNDCNGVVDDPPGAFTPCDTGLLGACGIGLNLCEGGALACVQQEQAQATDTCGDGVDNDCDGTVDPGCLYTFSGVQLDVPIAALNGWTQCYVDEYDNSSTELSTILAQCDKSKLLLGCRPTGSPTLAVAAHAPRADVLFDTGESNTPHDANGVGWYYNDDWSWGFAPEGSPINRNSCDIIDSQSDPDPAVNDGDSRICWHTAGGSIDTGYRCGKADGLGGGYERLVFHAD